jgi:hypothetical protein
LWHRQERDGTIIQITRERDNQEQDDNCACRPKQGDGSCRSVLVRLTVFLRAPTPYEQACSLFVTCASLNQAYLRTNQNLIQP